MPGIVETWLPLKFRRSSGRRLANWAVGGALGVTLTAAVIRLLYAGKEFSHVHFLEPDSELALYDSAAIEIAERGTWWAVLPIFLVLAAAIGGMRRFRVAALGEHRLLPSGRFGPTAVAGTGRHRDEQSQLVPSQPNAAHIWGEDNGPGESRNDGTKRLEPQDLL